MEGLAAIPAGSVHAVVTSPPYWGLRDYGFEGQIGMEANPEYAELGVKRLGTPWVPVAERKKPRGKRRRRVASQRELFE